MSVAINIENVIKRFGKDTIINGLSVDMCALASFLRCWAPPAAVKRLCCA